MAQQTLDLFAEPCLSRSPPSSTPMTTPGEISWEHLSGQMIPLKDLSTAENGRVRVWLPGHGHGSHGGFSTLNISDWPNDASACGLLSILETVPIPRRFYLSGRACAGILRRAAARGKELPAMLMEALRSVAGHNGGPPLT